MFLLHEILPHVLLSLVLGLWEKQHDEEGPHQADDTKEEVSVVCL